MSSDRRGPPYNPQQQQHHLPLNHYQNAHPAHDPNASMYHHEPSNNAAMDASQFNDLPFSFQSLSGQTPIATTMADQSNLGFDSHPVDPFSRQAVMASAQGHPLSGAPLQYGMDPAMGVEVKLQHPSMEGSDDGLRDRSSPPANSLDDSATDEFGLAGPAHGRGDGTDLGGGRSKDDNADAVPAWSELKTKAGKDRKRLPLACIACRRKKIRCSGEKPACKHCVRSRIPCVYKVNTRKAAPRTDYMAMLDKRLKRMEERIIKVIPKTDQEETATITRAIVKPPVPGTSSKANSKKRAADEAFGADLSGWAKAPSRSNAAVDEPPTSLQAQEAEETQLFQEGTDALPTPEIRQHLAEVFFDNIYGQAYHLLHKPSYMRKLKNNALPPVLILSVCAVAARFAASPKFDSTTRHFLRGEEWASHARDICTRRYEWPNITILTCLLILGLHEFGTCQGGRSWALGGQAIRMAFALQLHKDLEYDPMSRKRKVQLSFIDREIRRRIMWACFLMDRFNSSGTDRPMFIREETIKIPLPVKESYFQLDMSASAETLDGKFLEPMSPEDARTARQQETMGVAAYMIRSIALWGRIITYLNQGGKELDSEPMWSEASEFAKLTKEGEDLLRTLPESLKYSSDNLELHDTERTASQFLLLHISIQQNILFLNRAVMSVSRGLDGQTTPKEFLSQASAKTFDAANRISECLKDADALQCCVSAPFAGYCAFSSTTIHILGISSRNPHLKAIAEANSSINIKFLRKMMKYWGMFHWMVENIRSQYRTALDASRSGPAAGGSPAASPILQYGDWFNRYPHGVSDADFMDPATYRKREKGADAVLEQKPELQSAEEFLTTLSPPQSTEGKDNVKGGSRRKMGKRGQAKSGGHPELDPLAASDLAGLASTDPMAVQAHQPQGRFSGAQQGVSAGYNPVAMAQSQNAPFHAASPMSPANVGHYPHQMQQGRQNMFSPDMLSMSMLQQSNGIMQPLDRQLVFGGYSMAGGNQGIVDGNMVEGITDWHGAPGNAQTPGQLPNEHGMKGGHSHGQDQLAAGGMNGLVGYEASSAWFMPFNMVPPEASQDAAGLGLGGVDGFGGVFGNGSGMTTPNPMGGVGHDR